MQYVPGDVAVSDALSSLPEFRDQVYVANYAFSRNYKKRKPVDGWQISKLNHFSHKEDLERRYTS